jgi:hypothetical protein
VPSSGAIDFPVIHLVFGGTSYALSQYYRGGAFVPNTPQNSKIPTSGSISLSQFYGASTAFIFTQTVVAAGGHATNYNLLTAALAAGWISGSQPLTANITIAGVLGSTSTGTYAFDTGTLPTTAGTNSVVITINSGGYITGAGGNGNQTGTAGPAMIIRSPVTIVNNGVIQSGGVGGSGGSGGYGGGGAGYVAGAGAGTGGAGSLTSGGSGGYNSGKGTTNGGPGGGPGATTSIQGVSLVTFAPRGTIYGATTG